VIRTSKLRDLRAADHAIEFIGVGLVALALVAVVLALLADNPPRALAQIAHDHGCDLRHTTASERAPVLAPRLTVWYLRDLSSKQIRDLLAWIPSRDTTLVLPASQLPSLVLAIGRKHELRCSVLEGEPLSLFAAHVLAERR
jgi:hypothetical protein